MPVLYNSADDVRHAAAVSLGYVSGAGSTDDLGTGLRFAAHADRGTEGAPLPVPTMPDESAIREARRTLQSILDTVIAEETLHGH